MIQRLLLVLVFLTMLPVYARSSEDDHKSAPHKDHEGHGDSKGEGGHGEAGHADTDHEGEEEAGNVGPDKGIVEASERSGFKLSPEAHKNFEVTTRKLTGDGPWALPANAVVHSGEEVNLFRYRSGFFKRIDFQNIRKVGEELVVDSDDMREGDEIVLTGLGFLRIAELAAFGGVAHGHSH